jgi:hypothetical protein
LPRKTITANPPPDKAFRSPGYYMQVPVLSHSLTF